MRRAYVILTGLAGLLAVLLRPVGMEPTGSAVRVLDRSGDLLYARGPQHEERLAEMGTLLPGAVTAIEDHRFRSHPGIDPLAVGRAVRDNLAAGEVVSGASTLTMQVARMIRGSVGRGLLDKALEAALAVRLEVWHSKDDILLFWLNNAYFGRGAYGVGSASRAWFGKSPTDLTLAEAAFVAGLPQRPERSLGRLKDRQFAVLQAMVRSGVLQESEALDARSQELALSTPETPPLLAAHVAIRLAAARSGSVRTTLDADLQRATEAFARTHVGANGADGVGNVAAVVLDNRDGTVMAWLGSSDYFDQAALGANDGVLMLRQPGSALKPFVYAAALERGLVTPASILHDQETPFVEAGAAFSAVNYDRRFHGSVPVRRALASSYNVPAVQLADRLGPSATLAYLRRAGFASLRESADHYGVGLALGNGEVTLLELARAYSGLARGGELPRVAIESGRTLVPAGVRAVSPDVAFLILDILSDREARAPGFGRGGPLELPFPLAAKTGTSKDYRDNWAVGVTPGYTIAVWAGNFDGSPMRNVSGVSGAGTLMRAIALELGSRGNFSVPPGVRSVQVCLESGFLADPLCETTGTEWVLERHPPPARPALEAAAPEGARDSRPAASFGPSGAPVLRYPADGMIFQLDPILRPEHQQIRLQADIPPGWRRTGYLVDGQTVSDSMLALTPGERILGVVASDPAGRSVRSQPVRIRIIAAPARSRD